jgi:hypothetical protein
MLGYRAKNFFLDPLGTSASKAIKCCRRSWALSQSRSVGRRPLFSPRQPALGWGRDRAKLPTPTPDQHQKTARTAVVSRSKVDIHKADKFRDNCASCTTPPAQPNTTDSRRSGRSEDGDEEDEHAAARVSFTDAHSGAHSRDAVRCGLSRCVSRVLRYMKSCAERDSEEAQRGDHIGEIWVSLCLLGPCVFASLDGHLFTSFTQPTGPVA